MYPAGIRVLILGEVYPVSSNMAAIENQPFISADIFKII
jgi:hypothetical protein